MKCVHKEPFLVWRWGSTLIFVTCSPTLSSTACYCKFSSAFLSRNLCMHTKVHPLFTDFSLQKWKVLTRFHNSSLFVGCSLWHGMKRVGLGSILPAFMPAFTMWEASVFCCDVVSSRRLFQGALGLLQIYRLKVTGSILTKSDPVAAPVREYS